ncbi:NAD(P)-binding protein [Dissoconium aciculare CBS 342.82]|uniref:enoyl-[acyl-carrier-protein] reductase n=1 Tax=Dissoconium aciculare CBS 342.82 TaxID=1314786 RepID=A0A6J3MIJ1_9PEZI|nr:NAD(P)-binding protein [Dissoconium aciculare CBS 342.82]KAF1826727.1 NAD(P)-binding protein [Dissoconium aciculare CBS 342.82]
MEQMRPGYQVRSISLYGYEQAKALVLSSHGEPKDVLKLHGHSISPPHGDRVNIRFLASPINPADINQIQGVYPTKPSWTTELGTADRIAVGGNEGVAEVISKGSGVTGIEKGDWVIMKTQGFGTWRTHAQTTADKLIPIKNRVGLTPKQVGTISVNPCTAYRMLKDFVDLQPGEWFIQNGANSGVGRAAIQLARLWGIKSLNIIRKRDSEEATQTMIAELKSLGADAVITEDDLNSRDKMQTILNDGRDKLRLALNCVGGPQVNSMAKHLAPGSYVVTYGAMSKQPVNLPMGLLIFKDIRFSGFWVSRWKTPEDKMACVEEILDLIRQGKFKDVPSQEIPFKHDSSEKTLVAAVQGTLDGFRSGKGIFTFDE